MHRLLLNLSKNKFVYLQQHVSNFSFVTRGLVTIKPEMTTTFNKDLQSMFPEIVKTITTEKSLQKIPEVAQWLSKSLYYTVPDGSNNCAIDLMFAYNTLASPQHLTPDNLRKVKIISWCAEILVSVIFVVDDMMDGSEMRRGKTCWYRRDDIGVAAVNDCFLMEHAMYHILRENFSTESFYMELLHIFHQAFLKISIGQSLDLLSSQAGRSRDLSTFTTERYNNLVQHKSSYLFIYHPIAIAMCMLGMNDKKDCYENLETILNIAHFIQVENDYLDCYGDPAVTGKEGTDIANGALTWLAVTTLSSPRLTSQQRQTIEDCYGNADVEKVAKIKQVYDDLQIPQIYEKYKQESYLKSFRCIQNMTSEPMQHLFFTILEKIYRKSYTCA